MDDSAFPTLRLYSAITMREALWLYLMTLGVLYLLERWQKDSLGSMIKAFVYVALGMAVHTGALVMTGSLVMLVVYKHFTAIARNRLSTALKYGLTFIILIGTCIFII